MSVTLLGKIDKERRDNNEDACLGIDNKQPTGAFSLLAVANGLGG